MNISNIVGNVKLFGKKYSPEILLAAGIMGTVGTIVLACKETLKCQEVLEAHNEQIEEIHEAADVAMPGEYTSEDQKKDLVIAYTKTVVGVAKTYAPAIILGTLSTAAILTSFGIMKKRYLGMVSAYAALDKLFRDYRGRVVSEYGEDKDREFRYGLIKEKVGEITTGEGKKAKTEDVTEDRVGDIPTGYSVYSKFFMAGNPNWEKDSESNRFFLSANQSYFNTLLQARGYVFLNEVYERLGFEPTKAGQVVGWVKDMGDNFIDFGMYNLSSEATMRFINGDEDVILLDFNVDGPILDTAGLSRT